MISDLFVFAGAGLSLLSYGDSGEGSANESYQKRLREFIERQREELNCWEEKLLREPPVADRTYRQYYRSFRRDLMTFSGLVGQPINYGIGWWVQEKSFHYRRLLCGVQYSD